MDKRLQWEKIRFCFFDFDGTLCASEPDIKNAWQDVFSRLGAEPPLFKQVFRTGPSLQDMAALLYPDADNIFLNKVEELFKQCYDSSDFPQTQPYPKVENWLRDLKKTGRRLYIVTNKRSKPIHFLLHKLKWEELFDDSFSPDTVPGKTLNKAELLSLAIKRTGAIPEISAMIGDTVADIRAGQQNGIMTMAITWGYGATDELLAANPDIILEAKSI